MNDDIAQGRWKRLLGSTKEKQGILTGNDLERMEGKVEILAGTLQEKHGRAHAQADKKIERRLRNNYQKHIAVAIRAQRINKRQSIGW